MEDRRKGVVPGRKVGSTMAPEAVLPAHKNIVRQFKAGQSMRNTATLTGKAASTVPRVKEMMA